MVACASYGNPQITFEFQGEQIGDFDGSGTHDAPDIDILSMAVVDLSAAESFDLTHDEILDDADRIGWIEERVGTVPGDANINRAVGFADFLALSGSIGEAAGWANGDFDGDNRVLFSDFLLLSQYSGQSAELVSSVPGPGSQRVFAFGMVVVVTVVR